MLLQNSTRIINFFFWNFVYFFGEGYVNWSSRRVLWVMCRSRKIRSMRIRHSLALIPNQICIEINLNYNLSTQIAPLIFEFDLTVRDNYFTFLYRDDRQMEQDPYFCSCFYCLSTSLHFPGHVFQWREETSTT